MAYSNINRDKGQVEKLKMLKNLGIWIVSLIVIYSSLTNIWQQGKTLQDANSRNLNLESELNKVLMQNKILVKQIEYASRSAYTERKSREYLGLGGPNDYWLKMPTDIPEPDLIQEIRVDTEVPMIIKWWNLFTHLR